MPVGGQYYSSNISILALQYTPGRTAHCEWPSLSPQKALSFLSKDCSLVHRGICLSSVFVDGAGEWKLAGVEWMHASGDSPVPPKTLELLQRYDPPEVGKPAAAKRTQKW